MFFQMVAKGERQYSHESGDTEPGGTRWAYFHIDWDKYSTLDCNVDDVMREVEREIIDSLGWYSYYSGPGRWFAHSAFVRFSRASDKCLVTQFVGIDC